ncbi:hypothetical protein Q5752_002542 [Cryptotrichosporon argae]
MANAHASSSRQRAQSLDEDGSEDGRLRKPIVDGEDEWSTAGFKNQPVLRSSKTKGAFKALRTPIEAMKEKIQEGIRQATEAAKAFEDASEDGEHDDELEKIAQYVLRAIEQEHLLDIRLKHLQLLEEQLEDDGQQVLKDEAAYANFRQEVWEINHKDEPCPPVTRWLARDDADGSDDDVEMGGVTQTYRCPITMRTYEDACKNTECGHYYSFKAIQQMVAAAGRRRAGTKCPMAGCRQPVTMETLQKDPQMQRRADEYERRRATQTQADRTVDADFDVDDDDE